MRMLSYRGEAEEVATTIGVTILSKGNTGMLGYRGEGEGSCVMAFPGATRPFT